MSRHISKLGGGPSLGVISCSRPRCRIEHKWPLQAPDPPHADIMGHRLTDEQRAEVKAAREAQWKEVFTHPLPANWVRVQPMEYQEGSRDNETYEFHSPHCAALFLDALTGFSR